ncbi:hypothetical protein CP532_3055 [Ophiocordyceps camponoti-leonardi (nom. inval.)]|nr:hypothetical protein CP532_3055 [Ophiocordyceps camponoti-leonardi (nom. inval.)]
MLLRVLLPLLILGTAVGAEDKDESGSWFSSAVGAVVEAVKDWGSCKGCKALLQDGQELAHASEDSFVNWLQDRCESAPETDEDVCHGTMKHQAHILAQVLQRNSFENSSKTFEALCSTMVGLCDLPDFEPWTVPSDEILNSSGRTPTPFDPSRRRPSPSGETPLQVIHFTDIHIDPLYEPGANTDCSKPVCCRSYTDHDKPGNNKMPAGPFGDHKCDAPEALETSMYEAMLEVAPRASFAIFTGDIVDHAVWNTSADYNERIIKQAYEKMKSKLNGIPVFATAGNHEAHPTNSFPTLEAVKGSRGLYHQLSQLWSGWVDKYAEYETREYGSYSTALPGTKLRIISLNTNLYYRLNLWVYRDIDEHDPDDQIAWLVRELHDAEVKGEQVYIIGHTPPGDRDIVRDKSNFLDQVFNRYSSTIAAMFYGHTHVDHFAITYSDYTERKAENARVVSYIAPSLTPTSGMPAFRVYDVDPVTFGVLDSTTYVADMSKPEFQSKPQWTKLYSAKEAYGGKVKPPVTDAKEELTPAFWHKLTEAMEAEEDGNELFDAYVARKSRNWKTAQCRGDCKAEEICQLRAGRAENNCFKPKSGPQIHHKRQLSERRGEHDECGRLALSSVFEAIHSGPSEMGRALDTVKAELERVTLLNQKVV